MQLKVGDRVYNRVPAHYYRNRIGEVKRVSNTEVIVEYKLNNMLIDIHHNVFDLKYFEVI